MYKPRMSSSTSNSKPALLLGRALWAGVIVACILIGGYHSGYHASRVDYHGGLAAKQERLRSLHSPKVVVIGGSSATFGLDSEALEKALCAPVVNMSIHASLGLSYMVDEVKDHLGSGDLVITSFEHSSLNVAAMDSEVHILTVDRVPGALVAMPWYRRPRVLINVAILRLQAAWKFATGRWRHDDPPERVYTASGFNERGDLVSHLGQPHRGVDRQQHAKFYSPAFSDDVIPVFQDLVDHATRSGAQVIFSWSCIASTSRRSDVEVEIEHRMDQAGFSMLGDPADYVFPDSAFYDSHYHLRATGRQLRTRQLINDLCTSGKVRCCSTP